MPRFSYPTATGDEELDLLVPLIATEYAAGLTAAYLGRHLEAIRRSSSGLAEYLANWVADPARRAPGAPAPGWDYAFGDAYRASFAPGADHALVATAIGTHLGACGVSGEWRVRLDTPARLRWDEWLLPAATDLAIEAEPTSARIDYAGPAGSARVTLAHDGAGWRASGAADELRRVDQHGIRFTLLVRDALVMRDAEDLTERAVVSIDPRMLAAFAEALDTLARYTPQYVPWVGRTLHQLFLIDPQPQKIESGSVEHYLGLVHLTAHPEPLPIAELLVHEATHQYMNVIAKLGPLDDGSDHQLYWSPPVETERPVSKIVAAFHAFGNVLLFYRWCRERGLPQTQECERQEKLLGEWMRYLMPPVADNPALTETGNALCQPLLAKLRAA